MIKYTNEYNHYGLRNAIINNCIIGSECPRCSEVEIWNYVIRCNKTKYLRVECIKSLTKDLLKRILPNIKVDKIFLFVKNILRYLENDKSKDYKMNQEMIEI